MAFVNIQNTNFENGITNRNAAHIFGSMGHLDPTKFHTFMDDFDAPIILAGDLSGFNVSLTGTIAGNDTIDGGAILLTTGATDTNVNIIQPVSQGFSCVASRPLYFRAKLETADVIEADVLVGLMDEVTDITPTDGIFFLKADAAATVDLFVRSGGVEQATSAAIATMVNDTQVTFEFYWDGIDRVYFGVDGTPLGFVTITTLPTGLMAPTVGAITGATAAKTVLCDYLFASEER